MNQPMLVMIAKIAPKAAARSETMVILIEVHPATLGVQGREVEQEAHIVGTVQAAQRQERW